MIAAGRGETQTIVAAALVASFMQSVNISIPNAALLYIQGALSMADDEVGWIFSWYLVAGVVTLPMAGWLAARFGRRAVLQLSLAVFAFGLVLAAGAQSAGPFLAGRIVQGLAAGVIGPLSLRLLLDSTPATSQAGASLAWTLAALIGLLSGPSIGGWLSEYHGWPWLFYVSLPVAALVFLVVSVALPERRGDPKARLDFFGLAGFCLGVVGLQAMLDRGERMEWFDSAEIWIEAAMSALGFYLYFVHVLTARDHFLSKALFKDRNFVVCAILYFALGFVLLPTIALTSPMLDELLNYPADTTGYMAIPRSAALVGGLLLAGRIPSRFDIRAPVFGAIALIVYGNWRMVNYSPLMDWRAVIAAGVVQGAGLGVLMQALSKTAFSTIDAALRPEAMTLFNVSRLCGSTIGIALVILFFYGNTQAMHLALAKDLTPYRDAAHVAGSIGVSTLARLNDSITGQAAFVGLIGQFKLMMIAMVVVSPLALLLRNPRATA